MISRRVQGFTESVIREMTRVNNQYDGINLAQGMPNFPPPKEIIEAAHQAIDGDFHQYAITWGTPRLRQAIAAKYQRVYGMDVEAGPFRRRCQVGGQDAHLDLAGNSKVASHRFANGVGVRLRLEQRPDPRFHLEHFERLRQVVVAAHFETLCLVGDVLERAEEHHGHFTRGLARAQSPARPDRHLSIGE